VPEPQSPKTRTWLEVEVAKDVVEVVDVPAVVVDLCTASLVDVVRAISGLHADRTASRRAGTAFDTRIRHCPCTRRG